MTNFQLSFYLDENLSPEIAVQLRLRGIDVIRGPLGDKDPQHLDRAREMGRAICTEDDDFLSLHSSGTQHAGIVKGENARHTIGEWVKFVTLVYSVYSVDELKNEILYLFPID